jgi:opacity protein-like surface antigen
MNPRILLLAAALAAAHPAASAPAAVPPAGKVAATPPVAEFGAPGTVPVAQLWADFEARADEDTVFREVRVADDLFGKRKDADGAACKGGYDALLRASRRVPVSFESWYVLHA